MVRARTLNIKKFSQTSCYFNTKSCNNVSGYRLSNYMIKAILN